MNSMTAYALGQKKTAQGTLEIGLKSLNQNGLVIEFSGDSIRTDHEEQLQHIIKQNLSRGTLRIHIQWHNNSTQPKLQLNHKVLNNYLNLEKELLSKTGHRAPFSIFELLQLPNLLIEDKKEDESEVLLALFQEVLQQLKHNRAQEGQAIAHFLTEKLHFLEDNIHQITQKLPHINALYREKTWQKLTQLQADFPPERFAQEWANHLLKTDVEEELSRIKMHIESAQNIIQRAQGPHGKPLNFIMQELMRETNTLSAKTTDCAINHITLNLKVCIEQMREQIQNVE